MPDKRFLTLSDLRNLPQPSWLVEGLFERNSLVMLAGPSYSFKSFLLLDWILNMASGRQWCGRKTATGKIGYALGEGKSGLLKRVQAWITYNNPTKEELERIEQNFRITFEVPQLASKASTDNMLVDLEQEGFRPEVIAVDTFARSMVGLDENDAKDTGLWVESADRLRQLGYCVLFLHHTKKNTEFGNVYRGSSAIIGAMDTAMTLVRSENTCTLTVTKQKDHDEGAPMKFRRILVGGGDDQSCVLTPTVGMDSRFSADPSLLERQTPYEDVENVLAEVMEDGTFKSDRARSFELARRSGISQIAAQSRISRANKEGIKKVIII